MEMAITQFCDRQKRYTRHSRDGKICFDCSGEIEHLKRYGEK